MFQTLVISGGSSKGVLFLGALRHIELKYGLNFKSYFGTSAGAIICLLLSIGFAPLELVDCFRAMNFRFDLLLTKQDLQLVDYDAVIATIESFLLSKTGKSLTFQELYETYDKELFFMTYNYTQGRAEVLSRHTRPTMDCVEAVRLSCAIPLFFKKVEIGNDTYIDGAMANNFPLDVAVEHGATNILALNMDEDLRRPSNEGILAKINHLAFTPITLREREKIERYRGAATIINIVDDTPTYKLQLSDKDLLAMLVEGYWACLTQIHCSPNFKVSKHVLLPQVVEKEHLAQASSGAVASEGSGSGSVIG